MPTKIYAPNSGNPSTSDWQSPTSISIYNAGWNTVKVAYVYNLGVWKVVYPDPISSTIEILATMSGRDNANQSVFFIGTYIRITNGNNEQVTAELFTGSTASGTPIATQTFGPVSVGGAISQYEILFYSSTFTNGTYCIKITSTSITENQSVLSTGAIVLAIVSVDITGITYDELLDFFAVTWSSINQDSWILYVLDNSQQVIYSSNNGNYTIGAENAHFFPANILLGNTSYTVKLDILSATYDQAIDYQSFTTPPRPEITFTSITTGCQSISVEWTDTNTSSGVISAYIFTTAGARILLESFNFTDEQTYTFTSTALANGRLCFIDGYGKNAYGHAGPTAVGGYYNTISPIAPNPPTNVEAISSYWGNSATISWTESTITCTPVTAYTLLYKLSTGTTWAIASNSIPSSSTSYSLPVLSNRNYNFKILAQSNYGSSEYAFSNDLLTNNNPYSILMTAPATTVNTFTSTTISATIKNANNETILTSNVPITWSYAANSFIPTNNASISPISSSTNSSGVATSTFYAGDDDGFGTITTTTSGLNSDGSLFMAVNLLPGIVPTLTSTPQNYGVSVSHNNYNSSYNYSGSISAGGSLRTGAYGSTAFTVSIPVQNGANQPAISGDNSVNTVTCTISNVWVPNPIVAEIKVNSFRTGYQSNSTILSNVSGNRVRNSITYQLQNTANGNNLYNETTTATSVTYPYAPADVGKVVRWVCTANFNDGTSSTRFSTNRTLG